MCSHALSHTLVLSHYASTTLPTFPFICKVPALVMDAGSEGETLKDTRVVLTEARLRVVASSRSEEGGRVNESGPTIDLAPPCLGIDPPVLPVSYKWGLFPRLFVRLSPVPHCQGSRQGSQWVKLLSWSWQLPS